MGSGVDILSDEEIRRRAASSSKPQPARPPLRGALGRNDGWETR